MVKFLCGLTGRVTDGGAFDAHHLPTPLARRTRRNGHRRPRSSTPQLDGFRSFPRQRRNAQVLTKADPARICSAPPYSNWFAAFCRTFRRLSSSSRATPLSSPSPNCPKVETGRSYSNATPSLGPSRSRTRTGAKRAAEDLCRYQRGGQRVANVILDSLPFQSGDRQKRAVVSAPKDRERGRGLKFLPRLLSQPIEGGGGVLSSEQGYGSRHRSPGGYGHSPSAASSMKAATSFAWLTREAWLPATSFVCACILAANIFWTSGAMTLSFVVIT